LRHTSNGIAWSPVNGPTRTDGTAADHHRPRGAGLFGDVLELLLSGMSTRLAAAISEAAERRMINARSG
jgi:hypothetical protein